MHSSVLLRILLPLAILGLLLPQYSQSSQIVKQLPGFSGDLPFTLKTGYIGVGANEEVKLFYYFVESQRNPSSDPVMILAGGGPGCSGLKDFFNAGPLALNYKDYEKGLPTLSLNENSWAQKINVIYLDFPVGSGFSYSETPEGYYVDDYEATAHIYDFLVKWLLDHPKFLENELYVAGDSYAGIPVPMAVDLILKGNAAGNVPNMNLKGYVLSSPHTDSFLDSNTKIPYAHRMSLISDELYASAKNSCGGNYIYVNSSNVDCQLDLDEIDALISRINIQQILEPYCGYSLNQNDIGNTKSRKLIRNLKQIREKGISILGSKSACTAYTQELAMDIWATEENVQKALHVREGTTMGWTSCNSTVASVYDQVVNSTIPYHKNFTNLPLRALIMVGDHDLSVPHIAVQEWINTLNLGEDISWRPWIMGGQIGGYMKKHTINDYALSFVLVKGAGHIVQSLKPMEASEVIGRWIDRYPI